MDMSTSDPYGPWNEPWEANLLKAGPGRSGTWIGHIVPGSCFFGFAFFMLMLSLKRARSLNPGQTFADAHIPEKDPNMLRKVGTAMIIATTLGLIYEEGGEILHGKDKGFHPRSHQAMYFSYMVMGYIGILESRKKLPTDSGRMALVICQLIQGIVWCEHAEAKFLQSDKRVHYYLSFICFAGAAIQAYSVKNTSSTVAYIAGWMAIVLQGTWMFNVGFYACCIEMHLHMVGTWFVYHLIVLLFIVGVTTAYLGPDFPDDNRDSSGMSGYKFGPLNAEYGEDEEEHDTSNSRNSLRTY